MSDPLFFIIGFQKNKTLLYLFTVCISEKQVFYLADEGLSPGKGANTVVSYVPHYLDHYGLGETGAQFHFDNCSGQNKNNMVLWYALWRIMTGKANCSLQCHKCRNFDSQSPCSIELMGWISIVVEAY